MTKAQKTKTALVLSGGGARAAYQVGALKAISQICPKKVTNPFQILCGTSAGAINTTALAAYNPTPFRYKIKQLETSWKRLHCDDIYCSKTWPVISYSSRWVSALFFGGGIQHKPVSLLNNAPLGDLLTKFIDFDNIEKNIKNNELHAVSITSCGYQTGKSITFFQGNPNCENWDRAHSHGRKVDINCQHLLASAAIPFIFPAVRIDDEFYGDGNLRQISPLQPAIKLGANKVLVIGVSPLEEKPSNKPAPTNQYPSLAQTAEHVLNSLFLDCLEIDLERLSNIDKIIESIPQSTLKRSNIDLKTADVLMLSPSKNLNDIAEKHIKTLPRIIRLMLRGIGVSKHSGNAILSYLLFEKAFCSELISLGYKDTLARKKEIAEFLAHVPEEPLQQTPKESRFRIFNLFS